jgi:acetyl esterase
MPSNGDFEVDVRDVEYQSQGGKPMLARIYQPKGPGPFPAIVDVHGGAWHNGDRTNNKGIDQVLASKGVVVAALDFRQPPEAAYPASIADVNLGVRWLKAHASEFNGSGSVGAYGNSSGGHQVVLVGLRPNDPRYKALPLAGSPDTDANLDYVIAAWPVIDPLYRFRYAKENSRQTLIDAHLEYWGTEEAMQEGSCVAAAEEDENLAMPPILMMLKVGDQNHPQAMQDAFVAAYKKRGGPVEVEMFEGLPEYGMVPTPEQPETMRALDTMLSFIEKHSS